MGLAVGVSAGVILVVGAGVLAFMKSRNREFSRAGDNDAYHRLTGAESGYP